VIILTEELLKGALASITKEASQRPQGEAKAGSNSLVRPPRTPENELHPLVETQKASSAALASASEGNQFYTPGETWELEMLAQYDRALYDLKQVLLSLSFGPRINRLPQLCPQPLGKLPYGTGHDNYAKRLKHLDSIVCRGEHWWQSPECGSGRPW
jgi:hypothetical protein